MQRTYLQLGHFNKVSPTASTLGFDLGMRAPIGRRANDTVSAGASV